jgi:hypothetical protein
MRTASGCASLDNPECRFLQLGGCLHHPVPYPSNLTAPRRWLRTERDTSADFARGLRRTP